MSIADGVIPRGDLAATVTATLSRPVTRRGLLAALGATALLTAVGRRRPDRVAAVEASAGTPPPDYHGIVGVL
jgi:hypothetical protein